MTERPTLALVFVFVSLVLGIRTTSLGAEVVFEADPRAKPAIDKALKYLRSIQNQQTGGYKTLLAYAFLKSGTSPTAPEIVEAVASIKKKCEKSTGYEPQDKHHGIYEGATDLMFLADASPGECRPQIEAITTFIIKAQRPDGAWTYPGEANADTSHTQYGLLALWAAERTGYRVPMKVWSDASKWLLSTQFKDGGFTYWPGSTVGFTNGGAYSNMTFAGTACLLVSRIYIYGELPMFGTENRPRPKKFGVLDDVKAAANVEDWGKRRSEVADIVSLAALDQGINRGLGWIAANWSAKPTVPRVGYFYYSLERIGALSASNKLGGHDWFEEGLSACISQQAADGSWNDYGGHVDSTALSVLFLTRTTGRIIEKMNIAGGLQTGGRGLPDDLAKANIAKGKVKERKVQGGLDELLSELSNADASILEDAQKAIVEKVQIGNREELLTQMDTVRKLATNPNPDIRRTAVWALGRSGNLSDAMLLIRALNDNDVDVLVEANAALKYLSRKLSGVGVPESPFQDLPESATDAQKIAAVAAWRREALRKWAAWYARVRPFNERNDLFELLNRTAD